VSTLTVSVAEILGRPGEYRDLDISASLEGIQTTLARLDATPIATQLRAESIVEGILFSGRVRASAQLECARCLKGFTEPVDLKVRELYAAPGQELGDDVYEVKGLEADLEPMLRDAIALALPLNPLCRPDCKGLCGICGTDWNEGPCDCRVDDVDPRWAPLDALRERLEG
jgi:uncharacterized protein